MNWWCRWINLWMPSSVRLQGVWMVVLQIGTWVKLKIINGLMPGSKLVSPDERKKYPQKCLCYEMSFVSAFSVQNLRVNLRIRGLFLQHNLPEISKTHGFKWFQMLVRVEFGGKLSQAPLGHWKDRTQNPFLSEQLEFDLLSNGTKENSKSKIGSVLFFFRTRGVLVGLF